VLELQTKKVKHSIIYSVNQIMKQQYLLRAIKALLLLLSSPTITNSQHFLLQKQPLTTLQLQQQSYPPNNYEQVIHLQRIIQSLPRTFDPTNPRDTCYTPLYNADINQDGVVSINEYPIFIQQLSNEVIDIPDFSDLPFVLQVNFVYLNCLCPNDLNAPDACCANVNGGGILTAGTGPGEIPTEVQVNYLTVVCSDTQASVDYAIEMGGLPTRSPTTVEPTTVAPSRRPTGVPTSAPTTSAPTTSAPTSSPTSSPITTAPTTTPTSSPVIIPVTKAPSLATENPTTKLPTETGQPTLSPSIPTSIEVPTTSIKPTVPTTPSPTISLVQPSMQPSTAGGDPNNPGTKPDNGDTTFDPIAPGAVAGIVMACVGVALVGVLVTRKRKRDSDDDPSLGDLSDSKDRDLEAGEGRLGPNDGPGGRGLPKNNGAFELANIKYVPETGNYVPQTIEPSPPSDPTLIPMVAGIPSSPRSSRKHMDSNDDSSSAGASGWSSSAGISSLNTGSLHEASSFDTGIDDALSTGSPTNKNALATIAAASAVVETTRVTQDDSEPVFIPLDGSQSTEDEDVSSPNSPVGIHSTPQGEVTRADLDMAIAAGDWAAVGATAALLAGTSKSGKDGQEESGSKLSSSFLQDDSSSISREELDDLVSAGNWKGVVLAASNHMDEERSEASGSVEEDSSGGGSKQERDMSEIRSEVELLVKRVVPDELDNIDEMMLQFQGREEELVETLRTMQERTVAQRARQAVRKSAKLEARARAIENQDGQRHRTNSLSSEDPSFYDDSEDDSSVSDLNSQGTSEDPPSSKQTNITSLERAVQQGDWLAVGEAAAMMGGVGIAPADFGDSETSSYIETDSMHDSSLATSTASSDLNKKTRITHLDDLIAKGDWSGIVAAAGKYQAIDEQQLGQASEEELEALAEANMWKTIATHSKESVTETDDSAAAATDWAISRSLEQIGKSGATSGSDQSV